MIYVKGNLIEALKTGSVQAIAHQSNCFNTMGSGVALAVKNAFPEAYEADCKTVKGDEKKLGGFTMAATVHGYIFNLYGQYNYGKDGKVYTSYAALESALTNMAYKLRGIGFTGTIGLPKIGAGTGGGKWEVISEIIEKTLNGLEVKIYEL
jgi:O-acetyl-ADP-ribose deacetylase (regulator of RNase III)